MRGNIEQRSKGSWRLRYDGPLESTGRRKQITETVKGTKKDAEKVLRERLAAIENGGFVPKHLETVAEYMERWLDTYATTNTTPRTQEGYRGNIQRYINPAIGRVALQSLTGQQIQGMYAQMTGRGLSARTVLHTHRVLNTALRHAVKWGILVRNVTETTTPPKPQSTEMEMWDESATDRFIDAITEHRFRDFYQLALVTGMRRSELAGLRWENVDLVTGRLSVVSTRQRIIGRGILEDQPKTRRSRRSIALGPETVELLHEIRGNQIEQKLTAGGAWQDTGYVLTQADGRPMNPVQVSQEFTKIVRKAELPHLSLHGLRHAHATQLLADNVNPKIVSERLGHSNIATTMDVYSHVLPAMQEAAALSGERVLGRKRTSHWD